MTKKNRQKFATQVDGEVLESIREIARQEWRKIQALIDEALSDLVEKRRSEKPRTHVMSAYQASHERFSALYKKLGQ